MEVVVLVVVEGIRNVEREQSRSPQPSLYRQQGRSALIVLNNPLNYPISPSKGYRTQ